MRPQAFVCALILFPSSHLASVVRLHELKVWLNISLLGTPEDQRTLRQMFKTKVPKTERVRKDWSRVCLTVTFLNYLNLNDVGFCLRWIHASGSERRKQLLKWEKH